MDPKGKTVLGKGLGALISGIGTAPVGIRDEKLPGDDGRSTNVLASVDIKRVLPNRFQARTDFDQEKLEELKASILENGVIQPITVRRQKDGMYEIIAGERRLRASVLTGLERIPAYIMDVTSDAEMLELALVENLQREDLNAIEEARAYQRLTEDFDHSQEALARLVGKSRSHVANMLRLLDLPKRVQTMVVEGQLSMGHARALINAPNPVALAKDVERRGLSVRQVEQMVRALRDGDAAKRAPATGEGKARDPDIQAVEEHLSDLLGLSVKITDKPKRGGTVSLAYSSLDQLDMICQRLSGEKI